MSFFRKHFGRKAEDVTDADASLTDRSKQPTDKSQMPSHDRQTSNEQYLPPQGPPPPRQYHQQADDITYEPPSGPPPGWAGQASQTETHAPPAGSPPSHRRRNADNDDNDDEYALPDGPPPSYRPTTRNEDEYQPPPGPPPSHRPGNESGGQYGPPPAVPPPSASAATSHDWQSAVPDTSLLPPPPAAASDYSPSSNASNADARLAWDWCKARPLVVARRPDPSLEQRSARGELSLRAPEVRYAGRLGEQRRGVWAGATGAGAGDQCFLTALPLYYALGSAAPKTAGRRHTVYFEVAFDRRGRADREGNEPSLALGFAALPYPTWRMPGWERGSLAVHSDDGRRYVNNQDGGQDFVAPFAPGVVVGLGLSYWPSGAAAGGAGAGGPGALLLDGEVFFTRDGRREASWSLQEEMDASSEYGTWGIAGDHDLFGAIGTFGEIKFRAIFSPREWMYMPPEMSAENGDRTGLPPQADFDKLRLST